MNRVIINLSQRGGSHCRPMLAMLNRELPETLTWRAKSGNKCVDATDLLNWVVAQHKQGVMWWNGTNKHNQVMLLGEILPKQDGSLSHHSLIDLVRPDQKDDLKVLMLHALDMIK